MPIYPAYKRQESQLCSCLFFGGRCRTTWWRWIWTSLILTENELCFVYLFRYFDIYIYIYVGRCIFWKDVQFIRRFVCMYVCHSMHLCVVVNTERKSGRCAVALVLILFPWWWWYWDDAWRKRRWISQDFFIFTVYFILGSLVYFFCCIYFFERMTMHRNHAFSFYSCWASGQERESRVTLHFTLLYFAFFFTFLFFIWWLIVCSHSIRWYRNALESICRYPFFLPSCLPLPFLPLLSVLLPPSLPPPLSLCSMFCLSLYIYIYRSIDYLIRS